MTAKVGTFAPNTFGLHHMHGNVYEWCFDGWSECLPIPQFDPYASASEGGSCVYRGGAFSLPAVTSRSGDRESRPPAFFSRLLRGAPRVLDSELVRCHRGARGLVATIERRYFSLAIRTKALDMS
jgi:hypothetical protein